MSIVAETMFREEHLGEDLRQVFRHWNDLRGDRAMPERREIDPIAMRRALSRVWIYEREDSGIFRCRLSGEEINTAYGRRIQGQLASDVIGPKYDDLVRIRWEYMLEQGAFYHGFSKETAGGRTIERLCLPLADSRGKPSFAFGASQYFNSAAARLYPDSFSYISLDVRFYRLPGFERILENAPD